MQNSLQVIQPNASYMSHQPSYTIYSQIEILKRIKAEKI